MRTLDCGHKAPVFEAGHVGGTGYAVTRDGKQLCYPCSSEREAEHMRTSGRTSLYLSWRGPITSKQTREENEANMPVVTDWPGTLKFPVLQFTSRKASCFGRPIERTDFWFAGPDGYVWHGVNKGDMQLASCKRTKRLATVAA